MTASPRRKRVEAAGIEPAKSERKSSGNTQQIRGTSQTRPVVSNAVELRSAKSTALERQSTRPDRYRSKAGSPEHRAQLSALNFRRQVREHACPHCTERLDDCHGRTTDSVTGRPREKMSGTDCSGFHLPAKPLRLVCECGRTPCLPNQGICVFCFDEEEALGDALYGVGYASFEPQRVE